MLHAKSKQYQLHTSAYTIFAMLADFRQFQAMEQHSPDIKNMQTTQDSMQFEVRGIKLIFIVTERRPNDLIAIGGEISRFFNFHLYIQLKELQWNDTRMLVSLKSEVGWFKKLLLGRLARKFTEGLAQNLAANVNNMFQR